MDHPHIMLLVGEDTGRHMGCYGDLLRRTPNLDRLASQGARFDNAYSVAPVCAPARSALVTGCYPWSIGTQMMRSTLKRPPRLFTQTLRDGGYHVNWENKTDFNFEPPASFADETSPWADRLAAGELPDQPLFLYRNFEITHESTMWNAPFGTQRGVYEKREAAKTLLAQIGGATDPADIVVPLYLPDTPEVRQLIARYYDALAIQDFQIGQALEALERSGKADDTLVIYLTDHGRGLPREKRWCYDAGVHLPLIVRWPGRLAAGSIRQDMVNWTDLAPTILAAAGVAPAHGLQGNDFLCAPTPRKYAFFGRDRMDEAFDRVRGASDGTHHYIRNEFPSLPYAQRLPYMEHMPAMKQLRAGKDAGTLTAAQRLWMSDVKPAEELYDIAADPQMLTNLAADPQHLATLEKLRSALDGHLSSVGDLGLLDEQEMIDRDLVVNRIPEYRARLASAAISSAEPVMLRSEAEAAAKRMRNL